MGLRKDGYVIARYEYDDGAQELLFLRPDRVYFREGEKPDIMEEKEIEVKEGIEKPIFAIKEEQQLWYGADFLGDRITDFYKQKNKLIEEFGGTRTTKVDEDTYQIIYDQK